MKTDNDDEITQQFITAATTKIVARMATKAVRVVALVLGGTVLAAALTWAVHWLVVDSTCIQHPKDVPFDGVSHSYTYQDCAAEIGNHPVSWIYAVVIIAIAALIVLGGTKLARRTK